MAGRKKTVNEEPSSTQQEATVVYSNEHRKLDVIGANSIRDLVDQLNELCVTKDDCVSILYNQDSGQYFAVYEYIEGDE